MSAPVHPANGSPFEPGEEILWWLRPVESGSHRGYLVRRFTRAAVALGSAALAALLAFGVLLPVLHHIRVELAPWVLPVLAGAGLAAAACVLLTIVGLLALLIPEPNCPPSPRVMDDLLYVFTSRRLLVMRASRGSGRAYVPVDLAPVDATPPTFRVDEIRPGVGHVLVGVPGPAGWVPRVSLWSVHDPTTVAARLQAWTAGAPVGHTDGVPARRVAADDNRAATLPVPVNRRRRRGRRAAHDARQRRDSTFLA